MKVQELIDELNKHPKDAEVAMFKVFQGEELYHPDIGVSMKMLGEDRHQNLKDTKWNPDTAEKQNFVCLDYEF